MKLQYNIGIIIGRLYKETNRQMLCGILEQAYSLGFNASVFTLTEENTDEKSFKGEANIFNIINFSLLDGVVFAPSTFNTYESSLFAEQFLTKNCRKPVIRIGKENGVFPSIWQDDRTEFAEIVTHMIEVHNCRKIYCLSGPADKPVSHTRIDGYKDAMNKAKIPFDDSWIFFGDFWTEAAKKLGNDIADRLIEMPDAIVCANDSMAISLCDALSARGISIPEKIRISGYDGSLEARAHIPAVTSYKTSWKQLGALSMVNLYYQITGKKCECVCLESGILRARKSCGCIQQPDDKNVFDDSYQAMEDSYLDSNLSTQLLSAENLSDFMQKVFGLTYVFMDRNYYQNEYHCLCLCEDWDEVCYDEHSKNYRREGYSEKMLLANVLDSRITFPASDMFPPNYLKKDKKSVTFFTAAHFQDRCFGYSLLTIESVADGINHNYIRFCRELNNGLEFLCAKNELKSLAYRNYISTQRDSLTGLYNKESFTRLWNEKVQNSSRYDEITFILCVTITDIRQINENHGRAEGDKLLTAFADIVHGCCNAKEICIRLGGADFIIIGNSGSPVKRCNSLKNNITEHIESYNSSPEKDYRIGIRIATKTEEKNNQPDAETTLEEIRKMLESIKNSPSSISENMYYNALISLRKEIYQFPEKDWSLKLCSEKLKMSVSHFQRLYNAAFNVSCMHDVQSSKLGYAKKLLFNTSDTLQVIAAKCGYDYSHFMRIFKREFGITPTEYRKGISK